jgi:hypothetical protein
VGLQFGDPMFDQEAMKKRTYIASSPDRPAKKLGIRPLDLSKVGSTVHDPPTPAH